MTTSSQVQPLAVPVPEGAAKLRRHPSWLYRKIYAGDVKVCENFGRLMVPVAELERLVAAVKTYSPRKGTGRGRKPKSKQPAEASI